MWEKNDLASVAPEFGRAPVLLDDLHLSTFPSAVGAVSATGNSGRPGGASVTILLRAADSPGAVQIRVSDVVRPTAMEDMLGCAGERIAREGKGAAGPVSAPLARSISSTTIRHVRATMPPPFDDTVSEHARLSLSLREHHLPLVAHRDCAITRVEPEPQEA